MGWPDAAIAASAAILASALTGTITWRVNKSTLASNSADLVERIGHEQKLASEARNQERRQDAYVKLLKYANWLQNVNVIHQAVAQRQISRVEEARRASGMGETADSIDAQLTAFVEAGPTAEERKMFSAGPSTEDNISTWAIVTAFATDQMLKAFTNLMKQDEAQTATRVRVQANLVRIRDPLPAEPSFMDEMESARGLIARTSETFTAAMDQVEASKHFTSAFKDIIALARAELNTLENVPRPGIA